MNFQVRVAIFAFATAATLHAEDFHRILKTGNAPHISVSTGAGYVHVMSSDANEVQVTGHVRKSTNNWGWGAGNAEERIRQIVSNPPIEQNGDSINIGRGHDRELQRNIVIDYDVLVPRNATVEGRSGSGDVRAANLGGAFSGSSGSGDMEAVNVHSFVRLDTGSGSIHVHDLYGNSLLKTGSGDIEIQQSAPGDVQAETGSGSIRIRNVNGAVRAATGSGDVEAQGKAMGDWKVVTGSGSIRLELMPNSGFRVDASTGSGSIRLPQVTGTGAELNKHHVVMSVHGGGPALKLQTGSGDIEVR
ncbi:MAG: DUF4097 family beta strand repeat protein [Acidobacteria bacterium]|nr:DUF4097 family beta strand repeat protein [Acidobacteriota bacterium]